MSASLLYHTNQIENVQVKNIESSLDKIVFKVLFTPTDTLCPCCSHTEACFKGSKTRKLRMAPLGNKMAWLVVDRHRFQCLNCRHIWWPSLPFVRGKKRVTISFEEYVINLMKFSTIEHTAHFLDLGILSKIFIRLICNDSINLQISNLFSM